MKSIRNTSWGGTFEMGAKETDLDGRYYVRVQFENGSNYRTRSLYSKDDVTILMKAIEAHVKLRQFPFTDKNGIRQWTKYDPATIVPF